MSQTVGQVLCAAQARLRAAAVDDAKLDARILVAHALGIERSGLLARSHDPAPATLEADTDSLLARRLAGEPIAHITGRTEFYGLSLKAGPGALIPRSDSETLVDVALAHLPEDRPAHIADLGTGTGCLLLALLSQRPLATGEGIDASADAIALAAENAARTGLAERARFRVLPWSAWNNWAKADLIVSNPPYIRQAVIATLQPEVRDHEPALALDGGPDGLTAYRELIGLAAESARPETPLVLEIGYDQAEAVSKLLETAGFSGVRLTHDLSGNPRVLSAVKNQSSPKEKYR